MSADLAIIIVNWNGGQMLLDCLASIAANSGGLELQVIVVDNASRDGSRERAEHEFPQFTVINSGANLGFGRANNLARPLVKSDFVLFLNPDTVVLPDSLRTMLYFIRQHPDIGALGCRMRSPSGDVHDLGRQAFPTPLAEFAGLVFLSAQSRRWFGRRFPLPDPARSAEVMKLYGGCLMCRKAVLDAVGWFDERYFMYAEDVDLCRAISDHGWNLYYLATAEIVHIAGGTSAKAPSGFSILMKAESIGKLMRKHYGLWGQVGYRLGTFAGAGIRWLALVLLKVLARSDQEAYATAAFKCRTLLLWSLGWKKPMIGS